MANENRLREQLVNAQQKLNSWPTWKRQIADKNYGPKQGTPKAGS